MAAAPAPAAGTGKGKRKRSLSEDDVYLLLHRYAPATILTALQEVAQHAEGRRIDWNALVGKSATGITSPREFQMLWRYFAYQDELVESVDAGASPLGDDSDLECELEHVPNPSNEALSEASSLAKMLICGSSREQASGHRVNLEAPAQNSPNEKIVRVPSDKQLAQGQRLTNVAGPISNSKQASQIGPSPDPLDGAPKKKKKIKTWSKEEDADLAAGVLKYGEGNWEMILDKCNFRSRTSDQLSQRWALISKRPGSSKPATSKQISASTEERMATRKALSMAVDYNPCTRKSIVLRSGAQQHNIQHTSTVFGPTIHEVKSAAAPFTAPRQTPVPMPVPVPVPVTVPLPVTVQVQAPLPLGQQTPAQVAPVKGSNGSNKTRNNSKKQAIPQNPATVSSSIQAAAIAAGGRIATPIAAANHLKATQSKNVVHIRTRVTTSSKSSMSSKGPNMVVEPRTQRGGAEHLEPSNSVTHISGLLTTHATQQIRDVSEVAAANPAAPSSGVFFTDTKKALSTSPAPTSCNTEEQDDDSTFCLVTMDDLFPEDANELETINPKEKQLDVIDPKERQQDTVDPKLALVPKAKQQDSVNPKVEGIVDSKDADMLEFDQFVASQGGASINMDPDKSNTVQSAPVIQVSAGGQKKQLKSMSAAGRGTSVCAGGSTSGKKNKTPVPHPVTLTPTGTSRVNVSAPVTGQNKTIGRKTAASAAGGSQNSLSKNQALNTSGNQRLNNVVLGVTTLAVNAGGKANAPGSSQASMNGTGKANQPVNSQAITLVNGLRKVNPQGSSQASTTVNVVSKVNPPGTGQASTTVNVANKANPPGTGLASMAVNGANRANLPGRNQASKGVDGPSKANPPASQ